MKKQLLLLVTLLSMTVSAFAVEVEIDGLWYNVISKVKEAKVIQYKNDVKYSGDIVIPATVQYNGVACNVISIEDYAFDGCSDLTSVVIGDGVTSIGEGAFSGCSGMTSVTIGKGVTIFGKVAFSGCSGLTSVYISDLEAWCNILSQSNYLGSHPLDYAHHLFLNGKEIKDLVIPNSVTSIGECTFMNCSSLTSVAIPNSVTSIGRWAFMNCSSLTSVTIPNSVTSIGGWAFMSCTGLLSITIPNSVTGIGNYAFCGCSSLTSITIGSGVKKIYKNTFANCPEVTDVYCYAENVPSMVDSDDQPVTDAFEGSDIDYATLYVPETSIDAYRSTAPWSEFREIKAIIKNLTYMVDGELYKSYEIGYGATVTPEPAPTKKGYTFSGWSEIPETMPANDVTITGTFTKNPLPECAPPVIDVIGGKIKLSCETEAVTFNTNVTYNSSSKNLEGDEEIVLSGNIICHISVFASKEGYQNSDTVTKDVKLRVGVTGDANADGEVDIADAVHIVNYVVGKIEQLAPRKDMDQADPE